jgi:hypothetical protein
MIQDVNKVALFKHELLDSNGTYIFAMKPLFGAPVLMYRTGSSTPQFNKSVEQTYFRLGSQDFGDGVSYLNSDRILRESQST